MLAASSLGLIARTVIGVISVLHLGACGDSSSSQPTAQSIGVAVSEQAEPVLTAQINSSPLFDSSQGWGPGFAKAKGPNPGVVVGPGATNPNVFAQQFPAKPDDPFKLIARAASATDAAAKGRFQVNWTGPGGKFLSASIKPFDVTLKEQVFEHIVRAPSGAAAGTLYVVADGPEDVVRYTEMRVLGKESAAPANTSLLATKPGTVVSSVSAQHSSSVRSGNVPNPFPKPPNLTPLDGSGKSLTVAESQYYFYHAAKAMQRRSQERGMDFIMYVMPDYNIARLMPAIKQLRSEGIKVLAYAPQANWTSGVDPDWYWQKADSHWAEAAVRLTVDEILRMWKRQEVANRPFSADLGSQYATGFPEMAPAVRPDR